LYPNKVHFTESSKYETALEAIWSANNREAKPHCIFQPQSAAEVAAGLKAVVASNCPFSIKGGGHLHFKGACNIHGGFLFDLAHLDHLVVAPNRQAVRVGPGKYWGDVYSFLEKENLTVVGGRDASVGVPGFLLGGT
jgi:FAD/FMN-containing dehydrogenase